MWLILLAFATSTFSVPQLQLVFSGTEDGIQFQADLVNHRVIAVGPLKQSPKESSLIVGHCTANNTYSAHVVVFNGTMNPTNAIQCDDDGDKYTNCSSGFQVSPAPYYVRGVERIMQFAVNNETRCTRDGNCQLQIPAGCPNKLNMYSWHVSPSNLVTSYSFLEYSGFSFGRHSWCQTNNEVSTATGIVPVDPSVVHATVNKYITLVSKIPMCKE